MARNWADLPTELLGICSQYLCPKDLSAFRAVCHSWRSAAVEERSELPWLMLADREDKAKQKLWHEFFCLPCQRVHTKLLPEAKESRCLSSRGWLLTIGRDWELHMLKNPMSRHSHIIELPNLDTFPNLEDLLVFGDYYFNDGDFIGKFIISDSPITSTDYRVMVMCNNGTLGLWKPGDKEWTVVASPPCYNFDSSYYNFNVIFHKGCFFALNYRRCVRRVWINSVQSSSSFRDAGKTLYLRESVSSAINDRISIDGVAASAMEDWSTQSI